MLTAIPDRVLIRQDVRHNASERVELARNAALAARTPDADSWPTDFGPYPNRRTRRARPRRHAPTGTVTERQNRSDTARQARARRIKLARKGLAA